MPIRDDDPARARQPRIAAVGDFHFDQSRVGAVRDLLAGVSGEADVLAICGDFTTHGDSEQIRGFVEELRDVDIPIVAVLGNHDHEGGTPGEVTAILEERGVHVLDGTNVVIDGIGFAGVKGFGGGFGRGMLGPFGEKEWKDLVQTALDESLKLEGALRTLKTTTRVALLHYAPIVETLAGEPEMIFPFLGSSRLLTPIETYGATVVFHGHAHTGAPHGSTPTGIPVYNVALPLLQQEGISYRVWTSNGEDAMTGAGGNAGRLQEP